MAKKLSAVPIFCFLKSVACTPAMLRGTVAILCIAAIVSQNSFVLVFVGYRTISKMEYRTDVPVWNEVPSRGIAPFWGSANLLWKVSRNMGATKLLRPAKQTNKSSWEPVGHLQGSLGPSGPETPKKSEKSLPGLRPRDPPAVWKKSRKSLESLEKVSKESGESGKSLEKVPKDFFETFPWLSGGPGAGGSWAFSSDFFRVSGPEGQRDPCKWPTGSQKSRVPEDPTFFVSGSRTSKTCNPITKLHVFALLEASSAWVTRLSSFILGCLTKQWSTLWHQILIIIPENDLCPNLLREFASSKSWEGQTFSRN